jgi:8-amino-7-oxononanoate synthase
MADHSWDKTVEEAVNVLESRQILRSLRPICMSRQNEEEIVKSRANGGDGYEVFDGLCQWDRTSVEVSVSIPTFQKWLHDEPSNGEEIFSGDALAECRKGRFKKLLLFSGNDYLGLSSHPTISNAAANVCFQNNFMSTNLSIDFFHCLMFFLQGRQSKNMVWDLRVLL